MNPADHPQAAHLGYFSGKLTPTGPITKAEWDKFKVLLDRTEGQDYYANLYNLRKALSYLMSAWLEVADTPHKAATAAALRATAAVLTNLLPQLPPTKREG